MAYGLHAIAHKGYNPNGTGRDWFFLGDFEYRNGRKTPLGQQTGKRPTRPPCEKRGPPAEVAHQRSVVAGGKAKTIERWRQLQREQSAQCSPQQLLAAIASRATCPPKVAKGEQLAASSWQFGQHPGWKGSRYELANAVELEGAGVIRSASAPALEPGPGDHTCGIRGAAPHFSPESFKLGNDPSYSGKRFDLADGTELEGAGAIRGPPVLVKEPDSGNHTLGIRSKAPHFTADYHKLGRIPGWQHPERGSALKHSFHSVPCYPDIVRRSKSEASLASASADGSKAATGATTAESGSTYAAGDHTLGIRSQRPHFTATYDDHGQIPGWNGKRFDFGPLANARLRLTEWGRSEGES